MDTMPTFLTIRQCAATGFLPEYRLRQMCAEGKLPGFYAGKKILINFPVLCEQLDRASRQTKDGIQCRF